MTVSLDTSEASVKQVICLTSIAIHKGIKIKRIYFVKNILYHKLLSGVKRSVML